MVATTFTEAQVRRAVQGALKAGFPVGKVEVRPDGTIIILPEKQEPANHDPRKPESW